MHNLHCQPGQQTSMLEKIQWFWAKSKMPCVLLFSHSFPRRPWSPCWRRAERHSGCQWWRVFAFGGVLLSLVGCFLLVVVCFFFSKKQLTFSCLPVISLTYETCLEIIRVVQLQYRHRSSHFDSKVAKWSCCAYMHSSQYKLHNKILRAKTKPIPKYIYVRKYQFEWFQTYVF